MSPEINFEYPLQPASRFGWSKPVHPRLSEIINEGRERYGELLRHFLTYTEKLTAIDLYASDPPWRPVWLNSWFPGLDAAALYGIIGRYRPQRFIEVGSGNSTKFARQAITDLQLNTQITSIDPAPRAEIDMLCDVLIRSSAESVDISLFETLEADDILFVDSSHRAFMNSDVTVIMLEVLPYLKPGVLVQFHDIYLPHDYPEAWTKRYYNEQYLLASFLLGGQGGFEIVFPSAFVEHDADLSAILNPLWTAERSMKVVPRNGASFWLRKR
ncbi:class I SAM-dependent methyltransferase [Paenibacillus pinihumi]|uniref:class I SAM-dependent methyltransferase n=1 Tax=Paenibacillus pinihumi TaxID=669462 RepID=UPI0004256B17|nr:class I SAM-dependent methyltransferase [Paenibacillus pinihumi]